MRANAILFWFLGGFFILADALYFFWQLLDNGNVHGNVTSHRGGGIVSGIDWVGVVGIGLAGVLAALIAFFIGRAHAAQGGELPEDRLDATIEEGDAEQGFFAPWSWWPVLLAGSIGLVFLGVAIGIWISFIGAAIVIVSLIGWQYEFYRGNFAH
ncbi:cytochrome c oxidase subunit 4 [Galbitalea sp. SE-J8]|uniref:aa3-type cytochrome oxidase subunit IV n=1 Tax=Galbitalea sp. SE-J8 TaxID=3054952 RepID=UPI00259C8D10|nr:cytochrome c oxidase subunit 4 [Galbitalea sp. SE-J8]MDM4763980.1 cytochrome c oxidase subunit 4 [Galbitalea sp. SE-J8]